MKKYIVLVVTFFMFTVWSQAQINVWSNDTLDSHLSFTVKMLSISKAKGHFEDFSVKVTTTKSDYSDAQVVLSAQVASINTNSKSRDKHLRGADFFDVTQFPLLVFKSTSVKDLGSKNGVLIGQLTLHGITKPITLKVEFLGFETKNNKKMARFNVTGTLKRFDYTIAEKHSKMTIGNKVTIFAYVEFCLNK